LVYQGEVFVNPPETRQWLSIKLFALPPSAEDRAALELLLRHVRYRDSYGGTGDKDTVDIHGPYWLQAISSDSFAVADSADAEALIRTWAECAAPLSDRDRDAMERRQE